MLKVGFAALFFTIADFVSASTHQNCYEGETCLLPCRWSNPDVDVEWMRQTSQGEKVVHFKGDGHDRLEEQDPTFLDRTVLDKEQMNTGNMSLVLHDVRRTDQGNYTCYIHPGKQAASKVLLLVATTTRSTPLANRHFTAVSPLEVSIEGHGRADGVLLQCVSEGWPATPNLVWMDSKGRHLPADVMQTDKHPDSGPAQRYTVRSNVTVQKTDTNMFTCKVHLQGHNRSKTIRVPDEVFPKYRPGVAVLVGAVVGTAVICLCVGMILGFLLDRKLTKPTNNNTNGPGKPDHTNTNGIVMERMK